ncbi:HEPN domain-containing protein [candidate division WOR-3 bacterium]|nr:HEPN domain-containing protein [candidate division WOR-3 bacterium]
MRRLIEIACEVDKDFKSLEYAIKLIPYAVEVRYPDEFYEPTIEEAKEALKIARKIKNFVEKKI